MISKGFLKSSFIYTLGGAMPMVSSIILLPFYANNLSQIHFLQVSFYITISLLFQIFFSFSADTYFGVKYTALTNDPPKQKLFVGTTSLFLIFTGLIWLAVTSLGGDQLIKAVFKKEYGMLFWPYGFYAVLTAFFNSYFKTATNSLIYFKKPRLFLTLNIINFIATLVLSIGGLFLYPESIVGPMYGRLLSGALIFIMAWFVFGKFGTIGFNKDFLPDLIKFCLPYMMYVISLWVLNFIDRFMLQKYISEVDLNTYDLVLKCFFGIEFLQNSLTAVIFPKVYGLWSKQDKLVTTPESNRYFNVFTSLNIFLLILFCLGIPMLYRLLITQTSFYEASAYIGILAAGFGLRSILYFYLSTILFSKKIKTLLIIFSISATLQLFFTCYTSSRYGLMGVIYTGLSIKLLQVVLSWAFTKSVFTYKFNVFKIWLLPILYLLVNIVQFYFFPEYELKMYLLQLIVFSLLFYAMFRREIKVVMIQFGLIKQH